jgi:hypothetical protein
MLSKTSMRAKPSLAVAAWLICAGSAFPGNDVPNPPRSNLVSTQSFYVGMCDASAAVALNNDLFAVANDEDNSLRIYNAARGGLPTYSHDLSRILKVDPKKPETDLEGACWLGERIFWISSHGRNKEGEFRASRHRFFATKVEEKDGKLQLVAVGGIYTRLLSDLTMDPRLSPFGLERASRLPPKTAGALNIEGLCATPEHHLLIGFRNPIPQGRALVVPLLNPVEVINGKLARLGDPLLLDLGGRGIRDMARWRNRYLILGGSYGALPGTSPPPKGKLTHHPRSFVTPKVDPVGLSLDTRLYEWTGGSAAPQEVRSVSFTSLNPEAIIVYPDPSRPFQILSDDGTVLINGVGCKGLNNTNLKKFRAVWVSLPD